MVFVFYSPLFLTAMLYLSLWQLFIAEWNFWRDQNQNRTLRSLSRLAKVNLEVASIYVHWEFLSRVYHFAFNRNCLSSANVSPCHSASWKPSATFHNVFQFGMSWIILCHLQISSLRYLFPFVEHLWIFQTTQVLHRFLWWQLWKLGFFSPN